VIDDVWQATALSPLLEGGPHCTRLITTRNDQVLPEEATRLFVDAMESEEAIAVLCRNLPEEIHHTSFQPTLSALASRLGYWPLLLTLANSMLVAQVRHGRALIEALVIIEQAYEARGVLAFDPGNLTDRERAVKACIEVSLRHLEDFTSPHYRAVERYQELAIFPEDVDIPLETLCRYWQGTGGLATWEVDVLCMHLHDLSLLLTCDFSTNRIRLHDVMRSYLVQRAGPDLPALHAHFLDVSQQMLGLKRWADLPSDEYYLWRHLVLHLCAKPSTDALQATLTDLGYLTHKAFYVGIADLEADLLRACTFQRADLSEPTRSLFESLHQTIVRISHLLRRVHTVAEISGLLLSHLGTHPSFARQQSVLERELSRPFLTAWYPLPSESSSALLRTLQGHTSLVTSCAVSPDGSFIVSASYDGALKVWDTATGAEQLSLKGQTNPLSNGSLVGCAVSPDSRFVVSTCEDGSLKMWDAAKGVQRLSLRSYADLKGCAVSPDGRFIVSASDDGTLRVWETATGVQRLTLKGHTGPVKGCAVSPDGRFIVSASHDGTLKVWDAIIGVQHLTLKGHTDRVNGCAVSPDGRFIVSASDDKTLKMWDTATGVEYLTLKGHTGSVNGCAVSLDGHLIISASDDGTIKVWKTATSGIERLTLTDRTSRVTGCAVSPDGCFIVFASGDKTLKVWDVTTGTERLIRTHHTNRVTGCAVSPDGKWIVSASADTTLKVWETATGTQRLTLKGHTDEITSCVVSPDGRLIVSASRDDTLKVWKATTGAQYLTLKGHTLDVFNCTVSSDGKWIVSASADTTLKVWEIATGTQYLTLKGHTNSVFGCAVSPDGKWIVSASADDTLKVWNAATGAQRLMLSGHTDSVHGCAISPNGSFIVSASSDKTIKVWNVQTGQCQLTFPVDGSLYGCAFHPDGEHLVACGAQGVYFLRLVV
jgi:WD40 repeat protein